MALHQQTILQEQLVPSDKQTLKITAIIFLLFLFYRSLKQFVLRQKKNNDYWGIARSTVLLMLLFFNPIVYEQVSNDPMGAIKMSTIVYYLFFIWAKKNAKLNQRRRVSQGFSEIILQCIVVIFFHTWSPIVIAANLFLIHSLYIQKGRDKKKIKTFIIKSVVFAILSIALSLTIKSRKQAVFSKTFDVGITLMPLLYAHSFSQYLHLYQIIMFLLPYLIILPLASVAVCNQFKLTVCYFFCMYCTSELSVDNQAMSIGILFLLEIWSYGYMLSQLQSRKTEQNKIKIHTNVIIINILGLAAFIVSIVGYFTFRHFYWFLENTHAAGISYIHAGQLVFWISHALYLAQALTIHNSKLLEPTQSKFSLKKWAIQKIKQI